MRILLAAAAVLVAVAGASADTKVALTGENTKITFVGTKSDGKHEGGFKSVSGSINVAGDDLTTLSIKVDIDMNSLWSDNEKLTGHLKADDFFGVKDHPKATFTSTKVTKSDKGYLIAGDLTIRGKSKPISLEAEVSTTDGFKLTSDFKIDRTQFGMEYGKGKIDDVTSLKVVVGSK